MAAYILITMAILSDSAITHCWIDEMSLVPRAGFVTCLAVYGWAYSSEQLLLVVVWAKHGNPS